MRQRSVLPRDDRNFKHLCTLPKSSRAHWFLQLLGFDALILPYKSMLAHRGCSDKGQLALMGQVTSSRSTMSTLPYTLERDTLSGMQTRREVPRYVCELPARLSLSGGEVITDLTLIRVGIRGCATRGEGVPATGQKGMILVEWQGRQFQADAEVVWKKTDGTAGFRFDSVDEKNRELLVKICATHPMQPLTPQAMMTAGEYRRE